jgi:toxin-antitoxin system PIN domain toxin
VILVDANLLVYAKVREFDQHEAAREWLDDALARPARVGLPWASLVAFVRLVTNRRVFDEPLSADLAMAQVIEWLGRTAAWTPEPTEDHPDIMAALLREAGAAAELVPDAHLAAIGVGHGLTVASCDSDFGRFRSVDWLDPLAAP